MGAMHRMDMNGDAKVVMEALGQVCQIGRGSAFQLSNDNAVKAARIEGGRELYVQLEGWLQDSRAWAQANGVGLDTTHAEAPAAKKKSTARKKRATTKRTKQQSK